MPEPNESSDSQCNRSFLVGIEKPEIFIPRSTEPSTLTEDRIREIVREEIAAYQEHRLSDPKLLLTEDRAKNVAFTAWCGRNVAQDLGAIRSDWDAGMPFDEIVSKYDLMPEYLQSRSKDWPSPRKTE